MKIFLTFLVTAFVTFAWTESAQAQIERYEFDKAHTQILFFVDHLGFSKSQGEFHDYDGFIEFNRSEPEKSKTQVIIQSASIDMDDQAWDDHMKNQDFFHVEKYPDIRFKSTSIDVTGENVGKINGDLTILGVTKPVTLDVTFNKADKHPFSGKYVAGFSAETTVKREDFGMTYGLPLIGNEVRIVLEVEAIRQGGDVVNN